jgi:putative flippase GtrA
MISQSIISLIDFFYPPFKRLMPLQTFRYAACGGTNVVLDISLFLPYTILFFINKLLTLDLLPFSHILRHLFSLSLLLFQFGFLLSKYIVWTDSSIKGHVQLFRYFVIVIMNLLMNYFFLKLFVEYLHFYPTIAKLITTVFVILFSYLSQKHYSFRVKAVPAK